MDRLRMDEWSLERKEDESKKILSESIVKYGKDNIATTFTGGKDSTVVLHLLRQVFGGKVPIPVLNIDTTVKFKEVYEHRDRIVQEWGLNLIIARNDEAIREIDIAGDHARCCKRLKADVLNEAIKNYGWQALISAVRWDEQEDRTAESYYSQRHNPEHMRIHPILHFREKDIWQYIQKYNISYCSLYDHGYRSLGCEPCTEPQDLDGPERGGRSQDKEQIMKKLRSLGYF